MPSHTHSASQSAHTHSQPTHTHLLHVAASSDTNAEISVNGVQTDATIKGNVDLNSSNYARASGGDTTGSATPSISIGATGSGTAFSILPPYLVVNIWKRLS